jgi:murein L,D-transpeptidase YcbB/YkuD
MKRIPLLALLCLAACEQATAPAPPAKVAAASVPAEPVVLPRELADFYAARGHRPIWIAGGGLKPDARDVARRIATAQGDGLDPRNYGSSEVEASIAAAAGGDAQALAHAELLLTRSYAAYAADLLKPTRGMRYIDAGIAPLAPDIPKLLKGENPAQELRLNPMYEALRRGVIAWRSANPKPAARDEALVEENLRRARSIPARDGRYLIVDVASARLWMIDGRKVEGPMRVIVGKRAMQTPEMAGLIRYVALNPYWNIPPDLAQERARRVLKQGPGFLAGERIEILSDWGDAPPVLKPSQVDWRAAAAGRVQLRMRQLPGGNNVMGAMKFMLPNDLGIYLHDFPDKALFAREDRHVSSGCVRVEDAPRLARWLFGGTAPKPQGSRPEQEVDLPEPVPVYITYMTALPHPKTGIAFQSDAYQRDRLQLSAR